MRRRFIPILVMGLALMMAFASVSFANENDQDEQTSAKATYETKYTVKIYPGLKGKLSVDSEYKDFAYGEDFDKTITVNDVSVEDGTSYYAKGFRLTGHDNSEITPEITSFKVTEDLNYEVVYGVKGNTVTYTASFVDESGNSLADSTTYYGNVGDKPVVSYRYVEGYLPASYTLGKTLTENTEENVFKFVYSKATEDTAQYVNPAAPGTNTTAAAGNAVGNAAAGNAAVNAAGNAAAGNANTANIADNATPLANAPAQYTDLDNNPTPTAAPGSSGQGSKMPYIIGALAAALLVALIIFLLLRRRNAGNDAYEDGAV